MRVGVFGWVVCSCCCSSLTLWGVSHQMVDEMMDEIEEAEAEMWSTAEQRAERAVSLLQGLRNDGWLDQRLNVACGICEAAIAASVDRFAQTAAVVCDTSGLLVPRNGDSAEAG